MHLIVTVLDDLIDVATSRLAVTFTGATSELVGIVRHPRAEPILRQAIVDFGKPLCPSRKMRTKQIERTAMCSAEVLADRLRAAGLLN